MSSYSSFWHTSGGAFSQATSGRECRCARHCKCRPGGTCRCRGGCVCKRTGDAMDDELRRRYGSRSYARPGYLSSRQLWLRSRANASFNRRWASYRRGRLNSYFAQRFGWGGHMNRLAGMLGCPGCSPGSQRFAAALARWQRRRGLPATGVLTPGLWQRLRARMARMQVPSTGAYSAMPSPPMPAPMPAQDAAPPPPPDTGMPMPEPSIEPAAAVPADDAAAPPPDDAPPPDAAAPSEEYGVGFRARRFRPGSPEYYRALQARGFVRPYG
jgi:hypothetical protein